MTTGFSQRWSVLTVWAFVFSGCIQRQPEPRQAVTVAGGEPPVVAAISAAPSQATGKWGKVPGQDLLDGKGTRAFGLQGAKKELVEAHYVEFPNAPFAGPALRAKVAKGAANAWDVQFQAANEASVERGDVLLASFYLRTDSTAQESAEGGTEFVFELGRDPYPKSISSPAKAGREWKEFRVPFLAERSYEPGDAHAIFRLGYDEQTIDIAGVRIENFGKELSLADLPRTRQTYAGIREDAEWRIAAAKRIEEHRKGDLTVVVRGQNGQPLPGADVALELEQHAFGFGTAVPAAALLGPLSERFEPILKRYFNTATLENDLTWVALAGDWGESYTYERANAALDWLGERGFSARGHALVWPGRRHLPAALRPLEDRPEQLRAAVDAHLSEVLGHTRGKLEHWEVVNEPYDHRDLLESLGEEAMADWFKRARALAPGAKLFINDYGILSGGGGDSPRRRHYEETIRGLEQGGAPLGGIGMQGHFGSTLTAPEELIALLDRFAQFGHPIVVSEFDIVNDDLPLAADYTRDFYTVLFSHPAVSGVVMWGFWDGAHWKNDAVMYNKDWSLKPAGKVYQRLLTETWHTEQQGQTDASGSFQTRGFLGRYVVRASAGGQSKEVRGQLGKGGARIIVQL